MQNTKEIVIIAGEDPRLMIRKIDTVKPDENSMFRYFRSDDNSGERREGFPHCRPRFPVNPPIFCQALAAVEQPFWFHVLFDVFKRGFEMRRSNHLRIAPKIN